MLKEKNCALILGNKGLIDNKKKKIKKSLKKKKEQFSKTIVFISFNFIFRFLVPYFIHSISKNLFNLLPKHVHWKNIYIFKKKQQLLLLLFDNF